jgi:hypothetical protein
MPVYDNRVLNTFLSTSYNNKLILMPCRQQAAFHDDPRYVASADNRCGPAVAVSPLTHLVKAERYEKDCKAVIGKHAHCEACNDGGARVGCELRSIEIWGRREG